MAFTKQGLACISFLVLVGIFLVIYSTILRNNFETNVDVTSSFHQFPSNCTVLNSTLIQATRSTDDAEAGTVAHIKGCDNYYSFEVEFNPYDHVTVSDKKPLSGQWEARPWYAGRTGTGTVFESGLTCEETPLEVVRRDAPPIYLNGENVICWVPEDKLSDNDRSLYDCDATVFGLHHTEKIYINGDGQKQSDVNPGCYKIFPPIRIMPDGITVMLVIGIIILTLSAIIAFVDFVDDDYFDKCG